MRRWLLGDEADARVLPYVFLNFPFKFTAERALKMDKMMHPIVDVGVHPKSMYIGIFLLDKPDLDRPETWIFYILATWPKQQTSEDEYKDQNMADELRKRADGWADPFKSAVEWMPDDVKAKAVQLKIWSPISDWDNRDGRVTLAGDAAHSMTFRKYSSYHATEETSLTFWPIPDRGQGANNAVKDSKMFVDAMIKVKSGRLSLVEALGEYDKDVMTRGRQEVEISRVQTDAFHDHARFLDSPVVKHGIRPSTEFSKAKE